MYHRAEFASKESERQSTMSSSRGVGMNDKMYLINREVGARNRSLLLY